MIFGLSIGLPSLAAILLVLYPLMRRRDAAAPDAHRIAVYTDQLAEIDRDEQRGLVSQAEAEAVRSEINRRLSSGTASAGTTITGSAVFRMASIIGVAIFIPAAGLGLYQSLGSPGVPGAPYASRSIPQPTQTAGNQTQGQAQGQAQAPEMSTAVAGLAKRLNDDPANLDGWLLLARSYFQLQNFAKAANAFRRAHEIAPDRADIAAGYGEMLVIQEQGNFTEAARKAFATALAIDKSEPRALFYLGLDLAKRGEHRAALQSWVDLKAISDPLAPWMAQLETHMSEAAKSSGIDVAELTPRLKSGKTPLGAPPAPPAATAEASPGPGGPSRADIEAAQQMSPAEQQEMIRGMVQRLADRMKGNPGDIAGWRRLAGAYRVLGENAKAGEAEAKANALAKGAPAPPSVAAPSGPTQSDINAARQLSEKERRQMVLGMVQRLAARLKENPNDIQGWLRLARSYQVMGQPRKAREAFEKAKALQNENLKSRRQTPPRPPVAAPRGPSQADIDAARQMSPQDRQEMIRGMVQRLADRMKENPNDINGWLRLSRAYQVIGQPNKAREALERANALQAKQAK